MKIKKIQLIDWSESDFFKHHIKLETEIFDTYEELTHKLIDDDKNIKDYVVVIGYNPSNTTKFDDDKTILYLRHKIYKLKSKPTGYILCNLISEINQNPKNIKSENK